MKYIFLGLIGFLLALFGYTLFASIGFIIFGLFYGMILFGLFFYPPYSSALSVLIGLSVGMELLGNNRLGTTSLVALIIFIFYYLFSELLRFTSLQARYIVTLLLTLLTYNLLFFSWSTFFPRVVLLIIPFVILSIVSYLLSFSYKPSDYEFS